MVGCRLQYCMAVIGCCLSSLLFICCWFLIFGAQTLHSGLLTTGNKAYWSETYPCITYLSKTYRLLNMSAFKHIADLIISALKCIGIKTYRWFKHIADLNLSALKCIQIKCIACLILPAVKPIGKWQKPNGPHSNRMDWVLTEWTASRMDSTPICLD
jgi:hypothetical protein